jgi:hypothetical protein
MFIIAKRGMETRGRELSVKDRNKEQPFTGMLNGF